MSIYFLDKQNHCDRDKLGCSHMASKPQHMHAVHYCARARFVNWLLWLYTSAMSGCDNG